MLKNSEIEKIYEKLEVAVKNSETFFESFLQAYGFPKASINRALKDMETSESRKCSIKQRLLYLECPGTDSLEKEYLNLLEERKAKERIVFVTDFENIMMKDMLSGDTHEFAFYNLPDNYELLLCWCGREVVEQEVENPADVKAATEMGKLFELVHRYNEGNIELTERSQNIFLTRLLFCCFADDTGIFKKEQFRESIRLNTADDGSDLKDYLEKLFVILDTKQNERIGVHPKYKDFPYVNGGLFRERNPVPNFDKVSRRKLLECCSVDWSGINPDIFGSMFQTVINSEQRRSLGQHYTSVTNIMKVLKPLFLDYLNEELDRICEQKKNSDRDKKLNRFRERLGNIVVFDPACGSGNFLIIAYKELCHIEMRALQAYDTRQFPYLSINLSNFYGIEIDDFPCEVARLALWLVQHQINLECWTTFGTARPTLPLTTTGNIVCGNAIRLDWNGVCPNENREVYVCGNPPFAGHQTKDDSQRADMAWLFDGRIKGTTDLDYVSCWFLKASEYIRGLASCKFGLVSTNSLVQGKHVSKLWPAVLQDDEEIFYGYESFKWKNNAKDNAGVTVTIIGVRNKNDESKYLYSQETKARVQNINSYLRDDETGISVLSTNVIPTGLPKCGFGTMFIDGGCLILDSKSEKDRLLEEYPAAAKLVKLLIGSKEFIRGEERYCLWIADNELKGAMSIPPIKERLEKCRAYRAGSSVKGDAYKYRDRYWQAREFPDISKPAIIIPRVSSERRRYIPIGYLPAETVITDLAYVIHDAPLWLLPILSSNMHMVWMRAVAGRLKTDYRYSNTLVYNTFPFPQLTEGQKEQLEKSARNILQARANHYDMTMAQMYNDETMPEDLRAAHELNDLIVDRLFRRSGFASDEERLSELFRLYELNTREKGGLL